MNRPSQTSDREGETEWLQRYDPAVYPAFALTVDLAILTIREGRLSLLLVRRGEPPYRGWWALPGGHVRHGQESADEAARRELAEETGIGAEALGIHLEQLATYSDPDRDPRIGAGLHVATVAYVALAPKLPVPHASGDAAEARWHDVAEILGPAKGNNQFLLAFDHRRIILDALERIRAKLEYTTLALRFLEEPFSLAELRHVYSTIWGEALDPANFRRKVLASEGFVIAERRSAKAPSPAGGRPPELYRGGPARRIIPPLLRKS
jgi:8-oxo-dGTP diphosphatase